MVALLVFWLGSAVRSNLMSCSVSTANFTTVLGRSLPMAVAGCAVMGAAVGTFDYGGKNIAVTDALTREEKRKAFFKHPPPESTTSTQDSTEE